MAKFLEFLKTLILIVLFVILLFLVVYIPQNRAFEVGSSLSFRFLNLGHFFRLALTSKSKLLTDPDGWTNVLILGKPGKGNPAPELTDSIILASLKPQKAVFLSIPRDLYVKPSGVSHHAKINSLISQGLKLKDLKALVSSISGRQISYALLVDLELLKKLSEELDGINLLVKERIDDPLFPGPNYSYEPFQIDKGWRHLDGETLLKYVRTRYGPEGDFGRMKRQQQVLAALKAKVNNLNPFQNFSFILSLYDEFQEHISTDLTISEMKAFWETFKDLDIASSSAFSLTIKEPKLLKEAYILTNQGKMFVLVPEAGLDNYSQIQNYVNQIYGAS